MIHDKAHVDPDCTIGAGTNVWQFASVIRKSRVGENCVIAGNAMVDGAEIGDGSKIGFGAFCGPGVRIGRNVFVGPHVTMCNDFWPSVGRDGWFDIDSLIDGTIVVTEIGNDASIGAGSVVMPGIVIGEGAMVAAGSVVTRYVPPRHIWKRHGAVALIGAVPDRKRVVCSL